MFWLTHVYSVVTLDGLFQIYRNVRVTLTRFWKVLWKGKEKNKKECTFNSLV